MNKIDIIFKRREIRDKAVVIKNRLIDLTTIMLNAGVFDEFYNDVDTMHNDLDKLIDKGGDAYDKPTTIIDLGYFGSGNGPWVRRGQADAR